MEFHCNKAGPCTSAQGRSFSWSGWVLGMAMSSAGKPANAMKPWASKNNDLEIGTYPEETNLSLAESSDEGGCFPTL